MTVLAAAVVHADCGDDIGGERVPCGCGDVVVSDTRLRPGDPVVEGACPADGLILRAAPAASSLTLDLGGLELRGRGAGVASSWSTAVGTAQ